MAVAHASKVLAKNPGITITPGNPTSLYGTNFMIKGGGDEYLGSNGAAMPGPGPANDADTLNVVNDNGVAGVVACSPSGAFLEPDLF